MLTCDDVVSSKFFDHLIYATLLKINPSIDLSGDLP